jgi:hypothetical protein
MTIELLAELQRLHAFEPVPARQYLSDLHVRFDELTNTSGCEEATLGALSRGERVALVGESGAGKSSVIASVMGPLVEGLAPLPIPVSTSPDAMSSGSAFIRHVITTVGRWIDLSQPRASSAANAVVARSRDQPPRERTLSLHVAPKWIQDGVTQGLEFGGDLKTVTGQQLVTADEVFDCGRDIIEIVRDAQLKPVLVLDDTDRWTNLDQGQTRANRDMFFGTIVRTIAEELQVSMIVAVHPAYLDDRAYIAARSGFLDTAITVPHIPDQNGIGRMLARRAAIALDLDEDHEDVIIDGIIEPEALGQLFQHYASHQHSIRTVIQAAHASLTAAADEGADLITEGHVRAELEIG